MEKINVAFDVDGTLRCNCSDTCRAGNARQIERFKAFAHDKNTEMWVWSGGGAAYALEFARLFDLPVQDSHCISKIGAPHMQIAVDDQQGFALADINLIVREK